MQVIFQSLKIENINNDLLGILQSLRLLLDTSLLRNIVSQQRLITHFFSLLAVNALAKPLRVAALFSSGSQGGYNLCLVEGFKKTIDPKKLEIEFFNTQGQPIKTGQIVESSVNPDFDVVIGGSNSQETLIVARKMFDTKLLVTPTSSHPEITSLGKPVLRMISSSRRYAKLLSKFFVKDLKHKKVGIIRNISTPFSSYYADEVGRLLKERDVQTKSYEIYDGYNQFDTLATQVMSKDLQLIYVPLYGGQAIQVFESFLKVGYSGDIFFQGMFEGVSMIAKTQGPRVFFNRVALSNPPETKKNRGFKKFHQKHCPGQVIEWQSIPVYDAFRMLEKRSHSKKVFVAKNFQQKIIKNGFSETDSYAFDSLGNAIKPAFVYTVKNGSASLYKIVRQ